MKRRLTVIYYKEYGLYTLSWDDGQGQVTNRQSAGLLKLLNGDNPRWLVTCERIRHAHTFIEMEYWLEKAKTCS